MLHYFAKRNRATLVQDVFRKYLRATGKFWKVAQRCATQGSPDQKVALQKAIRLQLVLIDRKASRFAYLLAGDNTFNWAHPGSIDSINQRLDQGWGEKEEASLLDTNSLYRDIVREVENIKSNWDSKSLEEPILELGNNTKWRHAREEMADRVLELDKQLHPRKGPADEEHDTAP